MKPVNSASTILLCTQANQFEGECHYSLCLECWDIEKKEEAKNCGQKRAKRSTDKPTPTKILHTQCVHRTLDLKPRTDLWWCTKERIGSEKWYNYPHGCVKCRSLFVNIGGGSKLRLPPDYMFPSKDKFDSSVRDKIELTRKLDYEEV